MKLFTTLICLFSLTISASALEHIYLEPDLFIENSFEGTPEVKALWLNETIKEDIKKLTGINYPGFRIRYWELGQRRAWILEAIGKVKLITTGFVTENQTVEDMRVLIYRETHGHEVQYPFFRSQFKGLKLISGKRPKLNKSIDGISGATLSVNALTKLAKISLYLEDLVSKEATQ